MADGPSQIWSWDITKLRGPDKGVWYWLYVLLDIYSRYVTGWLCAANCTPPPCRLTPPITASYAQ